jgi:hypothetical protein
MNLQKAFIVKRCSKVQSIAKKDKNEMPLACLPSIMPPGGARLPDRLAQILWLLDGLVHVSLAVTGQNRKAVSDEFNGIDGFAIFSIAGLAHAPRCMDQIADIRAINALCCPRKTFQ